MNNSSAFFVSLSHAIFSWQENRKTKIFFHFYLHYSSPSKYFYPQVAKFVSFNTYMWSIVPNSYFTHGSKNFQRYLSIWKLMFKDIKNNHQRYGVGNIFIRNIFTLEMFKGIYNNFKYCVCVFIEAVLKYNFKYLKNN
jgi:hypothetical protein